MRAGDWHAALHALPTGSLDDLVGAAPFLVLAPHPDDETLGCGGLLAMAAARGLACGVVVLTDGAASHPRSRAFPKARLVELRRQEALMAVSRLGLPETALAFLDLPDAAAPTSGPAFDSAVATVVALSRRIAAKTLFVTSNIDPHCDHEAGFAMAHGAAAALAEIRLWAYPIWSLHIKPETPMTGEPPKGLRLDITAQRARKAAAIRCYASQTTPLIADDPDGFVMTAEELAPFLGDHEVFLAAGP